MSCHSISRARVSALLLGAAALGTRSRVSAQNSTTIRVGTTPVEPAAEVYFAKDMGFFANVGLDAEIVQMQSPSAIAAAIESQALDIGFSTVDVIAGIHQKNIAVVIIAPANESASPDRTNALIVSEKSPVQQAKELNGKTIGIPALHSLAEIASRVWIEHNGGDAATVKFVGIPFPAMAAALDAGRIDAAWMVEPFIGAAMNNVRVLAYALDGISKHFLLGAWFTTPQWANVHADVVKRFAAVMQQTAVWANMNAARSGEIVAKYTKIPLASIGSMARAHYGEQLIPALIQPIIDVSAKYDGFDTFAAKELIYTPPR